MTQSINNKKYCEFPPIPETHPKGATSFLDEIDSYIVSNDLQNSPDEVMDSKTRNKFNEIIKQKWDALKGEAPEEFKEIMQDIEDEVFCSEAVDAALLHNECIHIMEPGDFDPADRQRLVTAKANLLFQKLAKRMNTEPLFGNVVPVDLASYAYVQQEPDKALLVLWEKLSPNLKNAPKLTDPKEIRAWLKKNQSQLDKVLNLNLSDTGIKVIPPEITYCKKLQKLFLFNNQLSHIPDFISVLQELTVLHLANNRISIIPDSISQLQKLEELQLEHNQITIVPDSISQLQALRIFNLGNNRIFILPDSIFELKKLWGLYLNNNQISGIPEFNNKLPNLTRLDLSSNQISTVPNSIFTMKKLRDLMLDYNQISSLPDSIGGLKNLERLSLRDNKLSSLPDSFSELSELSSLDLSSNQFLNVPDVIFGLHNLSTLNLRYNQISEIQPTISKLKKLRFFHLTRNQISSLPDSFSELTELTSLELNENQFSNFPVSLCKLEKLQYLQLNSNKISSIPHSISELQSLKTLSIWNNQICILPSSILKLKNLKKLELFDNELLFTGDYTMIQIFGCKGVSHSNFHPSSDTSDNLSYISCFEAFRNYKCLTPYSTFVQLLADQETDPDTIKNAYNLLPEQTQDQILNAVCFVSSNTIWAETHLFDDLNILRRAVKSAIQGKMAILYEADKNKVYEKIYELAQPEVIDGQRWGKSHAYDNVLRLVDAMDLALNS